MRPIRKRKPVDEEQQSLPPRERDTSRLVEVPKISSKKFPVYGKFWPVFDRNAVVSIVTRKQTTTEKVETPKHVVKPRITVSAVTIAGKDYSQQDTRFTQPSDPNFAGAYVWAKGYNRGTSALSAKLPWTKVGDVHESPSSFLLDKTAESIIVGIQAYGKDGRTADFGTMPTVTITLS